MRFAVLALLLAACASRPQVIAVHPDKEPLCGWTRQWMHCCVLREGPNLIVRCVELEQPEEPAPKIDMPKDA